MKMKNMQIFLRPKKKKVLNQSIFVWSILYNIYDINTIIN